MKFTKWNLFLSKRHLSWTILMMYMFCMNPHGSCSTKWIISLVYSFDKQKTKTENKKKRWYPSESLETSWFAEFTYLQSKFVLSSFYTNHDLYLHVCKQKVLSCECYWLMIKWETKHRCTFESINIYRMVNS